MFGNRWLSLILAVLFYGCTAIETIPVQNLEVSPPESVVQFFYDTEGGKAEAYLARPRGNGPFPLIVLLHGHSWRREGASSIVHVAELFSRDLCYASLAISLPGYGMTDVAADRAQSWEITAKVIADAVTKVGEIPWVDRKRVILYGFSRGAVFAANAVGKLQGLRGVVLHSGAYDIARLYRETPSNWVRQSINPNGETNPSLFSILPEVSSWTAPTLILHGERDQIIPATQAYLLRDYLKELGKPYRAVIFPDAGHRLPPNEVKGEVFSFLTRHVGSACR